MLKLNLILNSLVSSLDHAIQGDTLIAPYHKSDNGQELRTFDYVVSNPPFKMDFSDTRERIAAMPVRFWAGVPKVPAKKKESMAIYTLFIQHVLNSLKSTGKGAIVVPTGFITAKSGVEKKILQHIVDEHIVYGCISMPSNVFANTGTNVSVLFFDNSRKTDKVVLIDASKLGEEYKDGNNQKRRLRDFEIDKIVDTFLNKEAVDDFSVAVTYDEIKEKKYSLSAGQYFDVKIEYVELSQDEFNARMSAYAEKLQEYFAEGDKLKTEIMEQLKNRLSESCVDFNNIDYEEVAMCHEEALEQFLDSAHVDDLNLGIFEFRDIRKFSRKQIGWDDRQTAPVGKSNSKTDQKIADHKIKHSESHCRRQYIDLRFIEIQHLAECKSHNKTEQIWYHKFFPHDHQ